MDIRKMKIDDRMRDVVDLSEYNNHSDMYDPSFTAIDIPNSDLVLPIITRSELDRRVGIVPVQGNFVYFTNEPTENNSAEYSKSNIINYSDSKSIGELYDKKDRVRSLENEILSNSNNITEIKYDPNDSSEMRALKEAINSKNCDINLYESRFQGNFGNDKRILNDTSITLGKIKKFAKALDMQVTLSFSDMSENVPNPIGKTITVDLLGGDNNEEE